MRGQFNERSDNYDVVIIGGGPAGLSTLSALQETFSLDHLTDQQRNEILTKVGRSKRATPSAKKICVIDPSGEWMSVWNRNFAKLDISFLRSPALAHPDAFDETSLLAYAIQNGREAELMASGCSNVTRLRGLDESGVGLWNMPSTKLFRDFCHHTASQLNHEFVKDTVVSVQAIQGDPRGSKYAIDLTSGTQMATQAVVLAMGALGKTIIPKGLANVPAPRLVHWKNLDEESQGTDGSIPPEWNSILVVGGGLTAVQVAQLALKSGRPQRKVTLCSRRPIVEKHLDIGLDWVDRRQARKCQSDFYHETVVHRLAVLKEARGGGNVPPFYMRQVETLESQGRLRRLVGNPRFIYAHDSLPKPSGVDTSLFSRVFCGQNDAPLVVSVDKAVHGFDGVIVACGVQPDCRSNPVYANILHNFSEAEEHSGFPMVSEDLEWLPQMYVVGGMASLNLGPDAGNLMGMRRAASLVTHAMGVRLWLRDAGNVLSNRFRAFDCSDSSSEEGDEPVVGELLPSESGMVLDERFCLPVQFM